MRSGSETIDARAEALRIIEDIREHWTDADGILVGGGTDTEKESGNIIDDLGDFMPLLAYWGVEDLCERHLKYVDARLEEFSFREAFRYTDLLLGLLWYARVGVHAPLARKIARRVMEQALARFFTPAPRSFRGYRRFPAPLRIVSAADSTFIEVFAEYAAAMDDAAYAARAKDLLHHFSSQRFFKRQGLLPELMSPFVPQSALALFDKEKAGSIRLMKDNTNFGFSILDLARHDRTSNAAPFEALYRGFVAGLPASGGTVNLPLKKQGRTDLLSSFALTHLMCDAYDVFKDERYRALAVSIADYWLARQSELGLFPQFSDVQYTYLDNETDMAIALYALNEITDNEAYRTAADRVLAAVLRYHRGRKGYVLSVDAFSGEPVGTPHYKTKYLALLLKPLIYLDRGGRMYADETLRMLMKDR